ncbi:thymidine phosphorylase-like [Uloborus diversus]|uniref:thymidine phosphorylase-like n=1 Tax=Uloborus diversus TaxID=327109 RepID=UPI00240A8759|nr:thymidine phosphorylase-like [Uloborus diversus]
MPSFKLTKIIKKKRNGQILTTDEIAFFVTAVVKSLKKDATADDAADRSQIGAMLMAIYLRGLNIDETCELTEKMKSSGEVLIWPEKYRGLVVDKHSTGGVGDKISLLLAPVLAALGYKVPMVSGRSLMHTGGTLDKLESIPGYRVYLSSEEIYKQIESVGCCIVGQTDGCCPADKVLYQCREICATVDCPALIIASILSKKLSEGLDTLILDVKFGRGSVFGSKDEALETARSLVQTSRSVKASALLTSMESPLGKTIGNSLEVLEAVECLRGESVSDVLELTKALGSEVLQITKGFEKEQALAAISSVLKDGTALSKFYNMLIQQDVSVETANELCYGDAAAVLPKAPHETSIIYAGENGYISGIDPLNLANLWKEELDFSQNNHGVGFTLMKQVGEMISPGDTWIKMHHAREQLTQSQMKMLQSCITLSSKAPNQNLIEKRIYRTDKLELITEEYE